MRRGGSLLAFLVLVLGGGLAVGFLTAPGAWFAGLAKPAFNPPNWIFAPAWTVLYVLIAVAGWRVWQHGRDSRAMRLWLAQLGFNFLWSPAFFTLHQIGLALGIIVLLLITIAGFIAAAWRQDRLASLLFVPYAAWVGFATVLNAALLRLN